MIREHGELRVLEFCDHGKPEKVEFWANNTAKTISIKNYTYAKLQKTLSDYECNWNRYLLIELPEKIQRKDFLFAKYALVIDSSERDKSKSKIDEAKSIRLIMFLFALNVLLVVFYLFVGLE